MGFNSRFGRRNRSAAVNNRQCGDDGYGPSGVGGSCKINLECTGEIGLDESYVSTSQRPSDTQPAILRVNIRKSAPGSVSVA